MVFYLNVIVWGVRLYSPYNEAGPLQYLNELSNKLSKYNKIVLNKFTIFTFFCSAYI